MDLIATSYMEKGLGGMVEEKEEDKALLPIISEEAGIRVCIACPDEITLNLKLHFYRSCDDILIGTGHIRSLIYTSYY